MSALTMTATSIGGSYRAVQQECTNSREKFWLEAASMIEWQIPPTQALQQRTSMDGLEKSRWFADGQLNMCENAVDRHVAAGRGSQAAVIYDSAVANISETITYLELRDRVAAFAGALRELGVEKGDRVLIYLPMVPEAIVAMLGCSRIGAIHSVVFGGFAANELATRIQDAAPKVIVTSSGGIEPGRTVEYLPLVARALEIVNTHTVQSVVVSDRPEVPGNAASMSGTHGVDWHDWNELTSAATPASPVPVAGDHPLYVLYTSGTTGKPKGVVRDTGGYATALSWSMRHLYDVGVGETMFTASDVGWVVGHSYIVYGPLIAGGTTVLYEGKPVGTPDPGAFWRMVEEHRVKAMLTAPTALRAIKREDPELHYMRIHDVSSLRALYVAGERLDPETWQWAREHLGIPVVDHWWQTETGWAICGNPLGIEELTPKAGSAALPMPGYDVRILDAAGTEITDPHTEGNIALKLPLPPGALIDIWGDPHRLHNEYLSAFDGYYATGDAGYIDDDGYVFVMGRTDDVINVAGHRLSTGALEEALMRHPAIAECAVVGVRDELKGQRASGFVTLKAGVDREGFDRNELAQQLVSLVRDTVGPVASFRDVTVLGRLPKTRSGKILRKTIRQIVDGDEYAVPATVEDPAAINELIAALATTYQAPPTQVLKVAAAPARHWWSRR